MTSGTEPGTATPGFTSGERALLAVVLVVVDVVVFALPLSALLAAYLVLARPPWFREWVERLYQGRG